MLFKCSIKVSNAKLKSCRGHGTYGEDDNIKASVAGIMEQVNKLISIRPVKSRYVGEIGDVVVGMCGLFLKAH